MKKFIPGKSIVPVSGQEIHDEDVKVLHEVVDSRWYTDGKRCAEFRRNLGKYFGKKYVILTNSGSSASLVAVATMFETRLISRVITTALAFPTTVAPIYQLGRFPRYVDIDPLTLSPRLDQIQEMIENDPFSYAGIFTHTLGFPYAENELDEQLVCLIADCCDAVGAKVNDKPVGSYSDLMTLSFFPAHHITSAQGGAVLTDNPELAEVAKSYTLWGKSCVCLPGQSNTCGRRFSWEERGLLPEGWDHKYIFDRLGYNLDMTEFQAVLGNSQLSRVDEYVEQRRFNYVNYLTLTKYDEFLQFINPVENTSFSPFGFPMIVKETAPFTSSDLIRWLEDHKITTRRFFGGNITKQPAFYHRPQISGDLSGTNYVAERGFWIGVMPSLTKEMQEYVLQVFEDFFKENIK